MGWEKEVLFGIRLGGKGARNRGRGGGGTQVGGDVETKSDKGSAVMGNGDGKGGGRGQKLLFSLVHLETKNGSSSTR